MKKRKSLGTYYFIVARQLWDNKVIPMEALIMPGETTLHPKLYNTADECQKEIDEGTFNLNINNIRS